MTHSPVSITTITPIALAIFALIGGFLFKRSEAKLERLRNLYINLSKAGNLAHDFMSYYDGKLFEYVNLADSKALQPFTSTIYLDMNKFRLDFNVIWAEVDADVHFHIPHKANAIRLIEKKWANLVLKTGEMFRSITPPRMSFSKRDELEFTLFMGTEPANDLGKEIDGFKQWIAGEAQRNKKIVSFSPGRVHYLKDFFRIK